MKMRADWREIYSSLLWSINCQIQLFYFLMDLILWSFHFNLKMKSLRDWMCIINWICSLMNIKENRNNDLWIQRIIMGWSRSKNLLFVLCKLGVAWNLVMYWHIHKTDFCLMPDCAVQHAAVYDTDNKTASSILDFLFLQRSALPRGFQTKPVKANSLCNVACKITILIF